MVSLFVLKPCKPLRVLSFASYQIQYILRETLQAVGAKAMVVGHTPQAAGVNW